MKVKPQTTEHYILAALGGVLVVLFVGYVYLLSASVVHVVIQKEMKRDFTKLHSEIAAVETTYIAAQHAVSADIASLDGFVAVTEKIFIDRSEPSLVLSETP